MKILTNYDFTKNEIQNVAIHKLASAPSNAVKGQIYFNTVDNRLFYYNGTEWIGADAVGATMTGANIVDAINASSAIIDNDNLSAAVNDAISKAHNTHTIAGVTGLQAALDGKVDDAQVLTNVPAGAVFTDTVTSINGKTGVIAKADIVALGIPAQDTIYSLPVAGAALGGIKSGTDITIDDSGNVSVNDNSHSHTIGNVTGLQAALDGKVDGSQVLTNVPAGAKFTDTIYTHPSGDGNLHVPATLTTNNGKVLKAGATAGSLSWAVDNDTITSINGKTGVIAKADIVALGIPAQDTVYTLPVAGASLGGIKTGTDISIDASGNVSVVDNSHNHTIANVTDLQAALDLKETVTGAASKASTAESNAKSYTDGKIADLLGSAPETLDTLNELAEALGNDPNFATTIANTLATKADKFVATIGNALDTSFTITHNLNTRDLAITLRETGTPWAQVITDVEMTTLNTVTVKFAVAPAASQYTITLIG